MTVKHSARSILLMKILVVLIHNNSKERLDYARPMISDFKEKVRCNAEDTEIELMEVSFQPELKPCSLFLTLLRNIRQTKLEFAWNKYKEVDNNGFLKALEIFFKVVTARYVLHPSVRRAWQEKSAIEIAVTSKHARAWGVFVESGLDYLMVLEDDIVFKTDSVERFCTTVIPALKSSGRKAVYFDLAGGFPQEVLGIGALESGCYNDMIFYSKPVGNTSCCYLIDKSMAKYFISKLVEKPSLYLTAADWLVLEHFMEMRDHARDCICIHFSPTIFYHGSFMGNYASFIRKETQ